MTTKDQDFNSQPHKEADSPHLKYRRTHKISTHSLTRRLTLSGDQCLLPNYYFNSQPHKEADSYRFAPACVICYFNSQPHKEADGRCGTRTHIRSYFNSQPHKEADRKQQNNR